MSNFSLINKGNIKNSTFVLDEKESHHVVSVLRLKKNDQLTLTDGQGTIYKAILNEAHKKAVRGKILNKEFIKHERNYKVHLALPLIKNSRFKIALEKSVELGVDELTPIRYDKSVKSSINHDKLLSSIHSACKQSMRAYFPRLNKLKNFTEWYDDQSCLLYTSPSPRDRSVSRMPSSA